MDWCIDPRLLSWPGVFLYPERMGTQTTRVKLYMPGGGSSSIGGADETADVDKLNQNSQLLDNVIGAKGYTSTTRPATPFQGQIILETDTGNMMVFDTSRGSGEWVPASREWVQQTTPGGTRKVGDVWTSW